ncbi:MAG: 30S ribosomal protein S14 [Gammaproteobacteria bacterium]|jgi:small subunit ribosomal protein S14|nr:30S ribosomal protein S14 [Gammaproteobacteria bacterium]
MAKKSMVLRDAKRARLVQKYAKKRTALKAIIANPKARPDDKQAAVDKLQSLPRDSSPSRMRSRCSITGRSRGYYQKFGLSRTKLRELTLAGNIPGMRKASW